VLKLAYDFETQSAARIVLRAGTLIHARIIRLERQPGTPNDFLMAVALESVGRFEMPSRMLSDVAGSLSFPIRFITK